MKKILIKQTTAILLIAIFAFLAIASGESTETNQGNGTANSSETSSNLGEYQIDIKECRLVKDFENKDVVIVKYGFTNNSDNPASFSFAFDDQVYQNGVGLTESYFVSDNANYNSDDQLKEIKKGTTLDVEVAYELNDTTTDIEVEVKKLISFNDSIVKKTFSITD